jgi:hypothetical protein
MGPSTRAGCDALCRGNMPCGMLGPPAGCETSAKFLSSLAAQIEGKEPEEIDHPRPDPRPLGTFTAIACRRRAAAQDVGEGGLRPRVVPNGGTFHG